MKALSLFNGISGLHLALDRAEIKTSVVYYSEIDKYANKITEQHYPDDVALGDVTKWKDWDVDWESIDLVGAGFPCQAWSVAGKQLGDKDERGMLFWTTLEIIAHVLKHNPSAKFLMENVKMKKDFEQYITHHTEQALGKVEKTLINSALVSAQNRNRYYWTNFKVTQPEDKGILLGDVIETIVDSKFNLSDEAIDYMSRLRNGKPRWEYHKNPINGKSACLTANMYKGVPYGVVVLGGAIRGRYIVDGKRQDHKMKTAGLTEQRLEVRNDGKTNTLTTVQKDNVVVRATVQANAEHTYNGKAPTITAAMGTGGGNVPLFTDAETAAKYKGKYIDKNERLEYRKLTPLECERLQTVPDNWTSVLSNTQRYKSIGNGWTIDVIAHILKCMVNKNDL
ncbi:MAG: DNA (cytosine-5-)-methyltransferase [Acinetobacter sp.]